MINFDVIQRRNPKDGTVKFYSQAQTSEYMTLEDIAENISRECTVTVHDIKAVLSALEEQIIIALQAGRSVRFGDLGSFHVTLQSKGHRHQRGVHHRQHRARNGALHKEFENAQRPYGGAQERKVQGNRQLQQHPGGRTRFGRGRRRLRLPNGKAAGRTQAACLETNTKPE